MRLKSAKIYTLKRMDVGTTGKHYGDPEIKPTLVCAKDHTDWFSGLEKIV